MFETLRTREQLGYLVHSSLSVNGALAAIELSVQSANSSVAHVVRRIDACLASFRDVLAAMTQEELATKVCIA